MFLQPRKTKFKKTRKGRLKKLEFKANTIRFGELGLKAEVSGLTKCPPNRICTPSNCSKG